ncbi:hypothetical protein FWF74_04030 [Candidatus Saccharibacteria bacterium]|nr:hypothetical protein [Candidatus Saccharibacteria bacterium]MCL1962775.1 hypothetical protein [Candidatus Saccharibacteria bacterium]
MKFIFQNYNFDSEIGRAAFNYRFENGQDFTETIDFRIPDVKNYDEKVLARVLQLAFVLIGVSYWKTFGGSEVKLPFALDTMQASFFNATYQEGMGQYAFENNLTRDDLAHFVATADDNRAAMKYDGAGILALQSGGKDSLLVASLLKRQNATFTPFFVANSDHHPAVLDELGELVIAKRHIDREKLQQALDNGAKNGHIPVTYITESLALIQAILLNKKRILVSIGHEGVEPHTYVGDLAINHQWSKTWEAEQLFSRYVHDYVSPDIEIGSPIREYSELKIAELFANYAWAEFGHKFSSCNIENYRQNTDNSILKWCGNCPKCANAYLIFAPFVEPVELKNLFDGQDLLIEESLHDSFKGLLGVDDVMKPFECVGEVDELRAAYQMTEQKGGYGKLPFDVPQSNFDYNQTYEHNDILAVTKHE